MNIKEFIFNFGQDNIFRVYGYTENNARYTFIKACQKYADTNNEVYKDYWNKLIKKIMDKDYICTTNTDFIGIRKIV